MVTLPVSTQLSLSTNLSFSILEECDVEKEASLSEGYAQVASEQAAKLIFFNIAITLSKIQSF